MIEYQSTLAECNFVYDASCARNLILRFDCIFSHFLEQSFEIQIFQIEINVTGKSLPADRHRFLKKRYVAH